jgi:thioredoxin-like negative regulator of GroEL
MLKLLNRRRITKISARVLPSSRNVIKDPAKIGTLRAHGIAVGTPHRSPVGFLVLRAVVAMRNASYKLAVIAIAVPTFLAGPHCVTASPTTQQSIDQLNADDPAERDAAEARLASIGKGAIDPLRQAAHDSSPEARMRALRTLRRIELFRLRDVPSEQLALADAYLNAPDFGNRSMRLNLLLQCNPPADAVLTHLIPIEPDDELRRKMIYQLYVRYRDHVASMIDDDDDVDAVLTLLDGAATMWAPSASDDAVAIYLTGHLDEQVARWTAEQGNGDAVQKERAAGILCQLYRVSGNFDQALKFARLSRDQNLIFLVLQDQGDWSAALKEPDDRWHDPLITAAYRACLTRLNGDRQRAVDLLTPFLGTALVDTDLNLSPSRLFLLNDLPEAGINLLLPHNPSAAFRMRVSRNEIPQAIEIAERFPSSGDIPQQLAELRQRIGELPAPTTQPAEEAVTPDEQAWSSALALLHDKKYQQAADAFGAIWKKDESRVECLYMQGSALKAAGQSELGEKHMHDAELIPLGEPWTRWRLSYYLDTAGLTEAGNRQRALALRTGGSFDEYGFTSIWNTRANDAIDRKQWHEAAAALDHLCLISLSTAVNWKNPLPFLSIPAQAHLCKAREARAHGDLPTVLAELQAYQQYFPSSSELVTEWTPALTAMGQPAKADELFNDVYNKLDALAKRYPRSRTFLNDLAWMSACCGRRLDDALKLSQAAVALDPNDYQMLDTLAEVHFRRGERDRAVELENVAMKLSHDPYLQRQLKRFQTAAVPSTTQPGPVPE